MNRSRVLKSEDEMGLISCEKSAKKEYLGEQRSKI